MLSTLSIVYGLLAIAPRVSAHIYMEKPAPFTLAPDTALSPLDPSGSDYPCKLQNGKLGAPPAAAQWQVGSQQTVTFHGSATHQGGSCQISVTLDEAPTKQSVFKVIHSVEGACPGVGGPQPLTFTVPKELPNGQLSMAWTWFNKVGNREMYMNCAPVMVSGGANDKSAFEALPDMAMANINAGTGASCKTKEQQDYSFADPGKYVERRVQTLSPLCGGAPGSAPPSPGSPPPGGYPGGDSPVSTPPAPAPGGGYPVGGTPGTPSGSPPGGVFAPGAASSAPAAGNNGQYTPPASQGGSSPEQTGPASYGAAAPPQAPAATSYAGAGGPQAPAIPSQAPAASDGDAGAVPTSTINTLITVTASSRAGPPASYGVAQPTGVAAAPLPSGQGQSASTGIQASTCATNGEIICNGGNQFGICSNGQVIWQGVAAGTECIKGSIQRRLTQPSTYIHRAQRSSNQYAGYTPSDPVSDYSASHYSASDPANDLRDSVSDPVSDTVSAPTGEYDTYGAGVAKAVVDPKYVANSERATYADYANSYGNSYGNSYANY